MRRGDEDQSSVSDEDEPTTARTAHAHHVGLHRQLTDYADQLVDEVSAGVDVEPGRLRMLHFLHDDLLAHLEAERRVLYGAARDAGLDALVDSLEVDHELLLELIDQLDRAGTGLETVLAVRALTVLIDLRITKEETVLIPRLTEAGVEVSLLLEAMIVQMAAQYGSRFSYV